jgi:flavin reductase (DIM6/NTAB) family NADH-FMN oxidoreductase RutF
MKVKPGRIVEAPVAMECKLEKSIEYIGRSIILGRVVHMLVRDDCIDPETLYVNSKVYHPIARLHADNYIVSDNQFEIYKPTLEEYQAQREQRRRKNNLK